MARIKIDYGIDLGTTNSAICRMEKGEPRIIKTDVLKDTMPSCISFNKKKGQSAGDAAYNTMKSDKRRATKTWRREASNTYVEFKRTMGTDTRYESAFMGRNYTSEELSAEVLKTLKSYVTDEQISSVVITVPAKFTVNQKTATIEAAKLAGFEHVELLQEPIAAAMAYGLSSEQKNGIWMVFDFGGGTFDAALLKVEDGIMQVFDTEGDNYLGGKNLDFAIVDNIIIPYIQANYSISRILADPDKREVLRNAMKTYAEDVKNQLSFKSHEDVLSNLGDLGEDDEGEEIELDLTLMQDTVFNVMRPIFQKAVDICNELLRRNHLNGDKLDKLILVGGPTHSPLIRQMLREQVTVNVDTSIDPMTAVAVGAALYASTIDSKKKCRIDLTKRDVVDLDISYESTSVETTEWVSVTLPVDSHLDKVWVELVRSDHAWSSGKTEVDKQGNVLEACLVESRPNSFEVKVYDTHGNLLHAHPEEITIIQGTKVGAAPLPYNIGIATWGDLKKQDVFRMAKGLEKNKPVPAVGVINNLRTPTVLRPGVATDIVSIPVYQVDDFERAEGRPARLYEYVANVVITGEDIDAYIPEKSYVDITIKVDSSEQMTIEAHFLASDQTVEKRLDTTKKQSVTSKEIDDAISEANRAIVRLEEEQIDTTDVLNSLNAVKQEARHSSEPKAVLQHLKEVLRKIDELDSSTEWTRVEAKLRKEFQDLEYMQGRKGDDSTQVMVEQLRRRVDSVIRTKDVALGREVTDQIVSLYVRLTIVFQLTSAIQGYNSRFGTINWTDPARARLLVNQGLEYIDNNPTEDALRGVLSQLVRLLPRDEQHNAGNLLQ